jgi:ribonuclease P/MRP protein subunit POP5
MIKTKLKPVLPSLREKKRYIVFEVITKEKINSAELVSNTIWKCSLQLLGQLGTAKAGLMVLNNKWNPQLQRGVIKVSHKHVDAVKAALTFADKINDTDVIFRSVGVSGILRKAEESYLKTQHDF